MIVFGHLDMRLYPLALYLQERQIPYGLLAHESEVYPFRKKKNDFIRRGTIVKGAQWVAANSRHTKSLVKLWRIQDERIKVVYPPICADAIAFAVDSERVPRELDELKIVTICRLVRSKGVDTAIRAVKPLIDRGIPCRYFIAGEGSERKALQLLSYNLGLGKKIQFCGSITNHEKWRLLGSSDVFVLSSRVDPQREHEGFGIAFLEASAFGLPAVGSNAGGIPDAVIDGETGILVPQESPEDLADALEFLYRNPRRRTEMGKAGKLRAKTDFSPVSIAAQFRRVIAATPAR
jgi:phosphatidylinositol alpha-1,6-mannosyltransferase